MQPFLGQLLLVPYRFAPLGWSMAAGQLLSIAQNTALFSLLGTTYGGDGKSTFALPNLQGNIPIGSGQGPGLEFYDLGQMEGSTSVTLLITDNPNHSHLVNSATLKGDSSDPTNGIFCASADNSVVFAPGGSPGNQNLSLNAVSPAGGSLPHDNMMPTLTMTWIIAMVGIFPPRS